MVKQMIIFAFSTLGLKGNSFLQLKSWRVDSGASNHDTFHNIRPYTTPLQITIANGSQFTYS
jgi:hypothetical protein